MKGLKKRQITMWQLFGLPERGRRQAVAKEVVAPTNGQGRSPDGFGYKKGPEVAPGREGRQRGSNGFGR